MAFQRQCEPVRLSCSDRSCQFGTDRFRAQVTQRSIVRPSISVDRRTVVAEPGGAVDQQSPDATRPQVPQGDGRAVVALRSSSRRVVVGVRARIARLARVSGRAAQMPRHDWA